MAKRVVPSADLGPNRPTVIIGLALDRAFDFVIVLAVKGHDGGVRGVVIVVVVVRVGNRGHFRGVAFQMTRAGLRFSRHLPLAGRQAVELVRIVLQMK